uniref:Protein tyrosine phosphatase n=1 Tax=Panagrolaimus davidi TaxID=227884 RepID=A0A914Q2T8_9BILA
MGSCCPKESVKENSNSYRKSKATEDSTKAAPQKTSSSENERHSKKDVNNSNAQQKKDLSNEHHGGTSAGGADAEEVFDKQLAIFVQETLEIGAPQLARDFIEKHYNTVKPLPKMDAYLAHRDKNRYGNVVCNDETRVVLSWPPNNPNDYIHANWVYIRGEKKYICTQGPTLETMEDFWRMVFQEKCKGIVMLTETMESGKAKCEQYWPKLVGETMKSGACTILNKKVTEVEKMLISTELEITTLNGEKFNCEHVLWTGWPDHGVPNEYLATLRLIERMSNYSPCLVHCSAGIGRTGTIVGIDLCQKTLKSGQKADMNEIVKEIRKYRFGSVQTDVQFVFMHAVFLKLAESRKIVTEEQLHTFFANYRCYVVEKKLPLWNNGIL